MDINKRLTVLLQISRKAKTENEKLAIWAEMADLLSKKVELMNNILVNMQDALHHVAREYMPDSNKKERILNFNFEDHINDSGTSNDPLFRQN